ncbi:COQ9 family protein [Hyphococcus sp. DH-69]|uniref:COQ9 family protein n=1 Tax=Hyphococcus formosus TaxID=3143534 RepID=UPI00398B2BCE
MPSDPKSTENNGPKAESDVNSAKNAANSDRPVDGFEDERALILEKLLPLVPFDGWTDTALKLAAREAGVEDATIRAAFPRGAIDAIRAWSARSDERMRKAMEAPEFKGLKIREKVAFAIRARLDAIRPDKEAARRAAAMLALPIYAPLAADLAWKTSDVIWRGLGDQSTDFNFYSKRGILTAVWTSTLARWLSDDDPSEAATHAFLDARIENVMQIEKVKAKVRDLNIDPTKPLEWLAQFRYGTGEETPSRDKETEKKPRPKTPGDKNEPLKTEDKIDEALEETFPASDAPYWSP